MTAEMAEQAAEEARDPAECCRECVWCGDNGCEIGCMIGERCCNCGGIGEEEKA